MRFDEIPDAVDQAQHFLDRLQRRERPLGDFLEDVGAQLLAEIIEQIGDVRGQRGDRFGEQHGALGNLREEAARLRLHDLADGVEPIAKLVVPLHQILAEHRAGIARRLRLFAQPGGAFGEQRQQRRRLLAHQRLGDGGPSAPTATARRTSWRRPKPASPRG